MSDQKSRLQRPAALSVQLDELLDSPQAGELVRSMPSLQLHRLVTSVGRADATELLALASAEQIRELLDLEVWTSDRLQTTEALDWLQTLLGLPPPARRRALQALDVELIGALLLSRARVHLIQDPDEPWDPSDARGPLLRTPDGWFLLELLTHHQGEQQQLADIVNQLYADDLDATRRLLHHLVAEVPDELEEASYRWRNARLQDLGFADPEEALVIYAYLDPRSVSPSEGSADRPLRADPESPAVTDLVQILPAADSFWHRSVSRVEDPEERRRLAMALLAVSNRAMASDQIQPTDLQAAQASLDALHARLSLGLEYLSGADPARAPAVLAGVALLRIARVGHSLLLDLRRKLLGPLRGSQLGSAPGKHDRLDPPLSLQVGALLAPHPHRYLAAERQTVPFRTLSELAEAETWIGQALAAAALADRLGPPRPWPSPLTFGDLFRTTVANRLLGRSGPLDADAVARLIRDQIRSGALRGAAPGIIEAAAEDSTSRQLAQTWLSDLEERLAPLDPDHLDLRLVSGLWVAR